MEQSKRLLSLDAFRGLTIAAMMLVNNQGDWAYVYPWLRHAAWHGWTMADVIFPSFLFISGIALALSFGSRIEQGALRSGMIISIVRRSLILIALGLLLNLIPECNLKTVRVPGVLQRIGICFFITSMLFLYCGRRMRAAITIGLLTGYWWLLSHYSPDGGPAGSLDPVRTICWQVDHRLFGAHTYPFVPVKGFDPEGLPSTIPSVATMLMGAFAGEWLRSGRPKGRVLAGMAAGGALFLLLGLWLSRWMPINKNLWTPSFALFMAGMALAIIAFMYGIIEIAGISRWGVPLIALGANPIAVYFLSTAVARASIGIHITGAGGALMTVKHAAHIKLFSSWLPPVPASLAYAIAYGLVWTVFALVLRRMRIFIKL